MKASRHSLHFFVPLLVYVLLLALPLTVSSQSCNHGEVRLTHGESSLQGRVEICVNGLWGTVCAYRYEWTHRDAEVVCRQLGRQQNITIIKAISRRNFYGQNSPPVSNSGSSSSTSPPDDVPFRLSIVQCNGTEDGLLDCTSTSSFCSYYGSQVGVSCIASDTDLLPACSKILSNFSGHYVPFVCKNTQKCLYSNRNDFSVSTYLDQNPRVCSGRADCSDCTDECHCPPNNNYYYYYQYSDTCRGSSVPVTVCDCYDYEFKCKNGFCVHQTDVCNTYNNCGDGSDENTEECVAMRNKWFENSIRKANGVASALTGGWIAVLAALLLVWFLILGLCCYIQICPLHKIYYGKLGPQPSSGNSGRGNP